MLEGPGSVSRSLKNIHRGNEKMLTFFCLCLLCFTSWFWVWEGPRSVYASLKIGLYSQKKTREPGGLRRARSRYYVNLLTLNECIEGRAPQLRRLFNVLIASHSISHYDFKLCLKAGLEIKGCTAVKIIHWSEACFSEETRQSGPVSKGLKKRILSRKLLRELVFGSEEVQFPFYVFYVHWNN